MYYVYIIRNKITGRYYVGQTSNLEERLNRHNTGRSLYTKKGHGCWELIRTEEFNNKKETLRKERQIKSRGIQRYLGSIKGV